MKRLTILALVMVLVGCFDDQRQQMAKCQAEAQRTYPTQAYYTDRFSDPDGLGTPMIPYVHSCMLAAGYALRFTKACVDESNPGMDLATNPSCYAPTDWGGLLIYRVERWKSAQLPN